MPGFFDLNDPQSALPLLGLLQGLGNAAMPSRTPVPFGSVIGQAAQGYMGGQQEALQQKAAQQDIALRQAQGAMAQQTGQQDIALKQAQLDRLKAWNEFLAKRSPSTDAAAIGAERPAPATNAGQPGMTSAILGQESGNNANAPNSIDGAIGPGQIKPSTFAMFAKPWEDIKNPDDNRAVSQRMLQTYAQQFGGDPARVAVAYFSGPANVAPTGSATPWVKNTHDGNGKYVSSYVGDIMRRLQTTQPAATGQAAATSSSDPYNGMTTDMLRMLGPDQASQLALAQKHQLTPDEVKAASLPPGTIAERDYTGHIDVVNKPVHWSTIPETDWNQYGVDPAVAPKGTVLFANDATRQVHIQYPPSGSTTNLTPEAIHQGASSYILTGKFPGTARDRASQQAIANYAATLKPADMSDDDWQRVIQNNVIGLHARTNAAGQVARGQALTAVNEGTVNNSIKILQNLMPAAASRGQFTDLNSFNQWLARKQNDPNAVNLKNAIASISNEYARVMTGATTGAPSSDAAREHAAQFILDGFNQGTMDKALGQMQAEMAGRSNSYASVLQQITGGTYGGPSTPNQAGGTATPTPPKAWPTPPPEAIRDLKMKKDKANFDAMFGPGSADRVLNGR